MTFEEFFKKHCMECGSLRCPADEEAVSTCGYYEGNIEGIEKKETLKELLKSLPRYNNG